MFSYAQQPGAQQRAAVVPVASAFGFIAYTFTLAAAALLAGWIIFLRTLVYAFQLLRSVLR